MAADDLKVESPAEHVAQIEETTLTPAQRVGSIFTIICAGFALISDGLQNNAMSLTNALFGLLYGKAYTSEISTRLSNSLTVGTIFGQIIIGWICDREGRKVGIVVSTLCIVAGIIICTAAHGANGSLSGFFWAFTIGRGLTGIGVGGEYPSSSTSASEAANERMPKQRGPTFIMVTNFVLSFGGPLATIIYLIVFEAAGGTSGANLSTVWRTVFGITIVFPVLVFIWRLKMTSSQLYRKSAIRRNVPYLLTAKYYWKSMIGTCGAWFLYDFVTFPNGVFSSTIVASIVKTKGLEKFKDTAQYTLLLGAIALPGCIVGALIINKLGRRNTMMLGFSGYLAFGLSVGLAYDKLLRNIPAFVILYGLMQSSGNLGPGDCLGLVSSESYATPVRGTLYGISAAIGKVGAVVGTQTFTPIRDHLGPRWTFIVAAIVGVLGIIVTFFFVRNDLERDLAEEDAAFAAYLAANGWSGKVGAEDLTHIVETRSHEEKASTDGED